jgi:hypothetical protein
VTWRYEDGGPARLQSVPGRLGIQAGSRLRATTRLAPASTMVVGDEERLLLLRHTAGDGAVGVVESIDAQSLDVVASSPELPGGPVWPGGIGIHPSGSIHVVFGNHAHRLGPDLRVVVSRRLPRDRPYNSFVTVSDGTLVTKDFGGSLPNAPVPPEEREACELAALHPESLDVLSRLVLPEASIARLSAEGSDVYVVGDSSLFRVNWDGEELRLDPSMATPYRVFDGQTYGWDCVLALGAAWFLDDGEGSERFAGTMRGLGVSIAPLHLVRVDLATGLVRLAEVCGLIGGLVANPPLVDVDRRLVVAYDSGNGVVVCLDADTLELRWRREQDHACHLLLYAGSGELVTGDGVDVVVLDISSGAELARVDPGHGIQSVLFPCPGRGRDFYVCTFMGVSRIEVVD